MAEDCLLLNVAAPAAAVKNVANSAVTALLPVMLWIHGGGYFSGESNDVAIDALVHHSKNAVVVVSLNYRLGIFGFLASDKIKLRSSDNSAGNFGIQDQHLTMRWVRDHISSFGGNGSDITLFGQSAGANSVINHLVRPASFLLYNKVIIQSGAYDNAAVTFEVAKNQYHNVLAANGCQTLDCLLHRNASDLIKYSGGAPGTWNPVVDGVSLTGFPVDLIAAKAFNARAAVLIGSVRDEQAYFFVAKHYPKNLSQFQLNTWLIGDVGATHLQATLALYAPDVYPYPTNKGPYNLWWWTAMRAFTDRVPGLGPCAVRWLAHLLHQGGATSVRGYIFAHPPQEVGDGSVPGLGPGNVLVPHGSEIRYVFGNVARRSTSGEDTTAGEHLLAANMALYWATFAIRGDPNHFGAPDWPMMFNDSHAIRDSHTAPSTLNPIRNVVMRFDVQRNGGVRPQTGLRQAPCDFMTALYNNSNVLP